MSNLTSIPTENNDMKKALAIISREMPEVIEYHRILAKIRREMYLAHIKEGFTKEEALEICKGPLS